MLLIRNSFPVVNTDRFFFRSHCALCANMSIFKELSDQKIFRPGPKTCAAGRERLLPRARSGAIRPRSDRPLTIENNAVFHAQRVAISGSRSIAKPRAREKNKKVQGPVTGFPIEIAALGPLPLPPNATR
jgi:hypothetical protein